MTNYLIKIDELKEIMFKVTTMEIAYDKACELISEICQKRALTTHDVINWVKLEDEEPDGKDVYWCVNATGNLYMCKYEKSMFRRKKQFINCIGRGWQVDNIVKWQKLILPCL